MIERIERSIRARWRELGLPGRAPARLDFFLSSGSEGRHGKVLFHVFRAGESRPLLVGKIPRDGTARQWALHEHAVLKELEGAAPRNAGRLFPRALLREETENRVATVQTILPGVPLDRRIADLRERDRPVREIHDRATSWLAELWGETGLFEGAEGVLWEPFLRSAHFFLETWEPEGAIRREIESLIREVEARATETSLYGFGHGDFRASNLIVERERIGAIDWEFGEKRQFPWLDPIHFAVDCSLRDASRRGLDRLRGFEDGFFRPGRPRDRNRAFLLTCFAEGGVREDLFPLLLPAYLLFATHRMARLFSVDHPVTHTRKRIVERCLRPGARRELADPVPAA
jgi:hypothetical protein